MTGLVKAVIEMSSKIQPAPPEEYVPMVKVNGVRHAPAAGAPGAHSQTRCFGGSVQRHHSDRVKSEPPPHELLFLTLTLGWESPGVAVLYCLLFTHTTSRGKAGGKLPFVHSSGPPTSPAHAGTVAAGRPVRTSRGFVQHWGGDRHGEHTGERCAWARLQRQVCTPKP